MIYTVEVTYTEKYSSERKRLTRGNVPEERVFTVMREMGEAVSFLAPGGKVHRNTATPVNLEHR